MNSRERIIAALRRETPDRIPIFEWFIDSAVTQPLCQTSDPIEVVERLDLDAINIRPDYTKRWIDADLFCDEWGISRRLTGDVLPAACSHPIESLVNAASFVFPEVDSKERFVTLEKAITQFDGRRAVVLNLRDGFSDMRDLLGYENALMGMIAQPEEFADLLDRVVDYNLGLARVARERYGIEIVATTDDICSGRGPIFSPKVYRSLIHPRFARVMGGYHDLGLYTIKHCDGNIRPFLDLWVEAGIDCLDPIDPGGGLEMGEMKEQYGERICLKGNIDCTGALCSGTPEDVEDEVRRCLERGGKKGRILSSSNTIHRGVKPENFAAMLEVARNYRWD